MLAVVSATAFFAHAPQGNNWFGTVVLTLLANLDTRYLFVLPVLGTYLLFHECWSVQKVDKNAVINSAEKDAPCTNFVRKVHFSVHSFVSLWIIVLSVFFISVGPFFVKEHVSFVAFVTQAC